MGVPDRKTRREFPPAKILCGIETEFGIIRRDVEESDPVVESMELVRSFRETSFGTWAYEEEDPRADARGGRVDRLAQDEEEEAFVRSDLKRGFSFRESKSDRILKNGARFYNDHTHPEYSTPECLSIRDLLLFDRAGTEKSLPSSGRKVDRNRFPQMDPKDLQRGIKGGANHLDFSVNPSGSQDRRIDHLRSIRGKVVRPTFDATLEILGIHLGESVPVDFSPGGREALLRTFRDRLFERSDANVVFEVLRRSGARTPIYRSDLSSGAILGSIVQRAKEKALLREIEEGKGGGLTLEDLLWALDNEYEEGDILPPPDAAVDWMGLLDMETNDVVDVRRVRRLSSGARIPRAIE